MKHKTKSIHYISGIVLIIFISLHLINHCVAVFGANADIEMMNSLRKIYRNPFIEIILLLSILIQIISGIKLLKTTEPKQSFYEKIHIYSGVYLAFFLVIHVSAVLLGRYYGYDTNFYYSAITFNFFPLYLIFIPYYSLAILSFFGHLASIHHKKMARSFFGLSPLLQSNIIFGIGFCTIIIIVLGQIDFFRGVNFPIEYIQLVEKFL